MPIAIYASEAKTDVRRIVHGAIDQRRLVLFHSGNNGIRLHSRVSVGLELLRSWRAKSRCSSSRYMGLVYPLPSPPRKGEGAGRCLIGSSARQPDGSRIRHFFPLPTLRRGPTCFPFRLPPACGEGQISSFPAPSPVRGGLGRGALFPLPPFLPRFGCSCSCSLLAIIWGADAEPADDVRPPRAARARSRRPQNSQIKLRPLFPLQGFPA
jgi:hypothetical protein